MLEDYSLEEHYVRILQAAGEAWDRMHQAREALPKGGLTVPTRDGGLKCHPAVGIERDIRISSMRAVRELDLDGGTPEPVGAAATPVRQAQAAAADTAKPHVPDVRAGDRRSGHRRGACRPLARLARSAASLGLATRFEPATAETSTGYTTRCPAVSTSWRGVPAYGA